MGSPRVRDRASREVTRTERNTASTSSSNASESSSSEASSSAPDAADAASGSDEPTSDPPLAEDASAEDASEPPVSNARIIRSSCVHGAPLRSSRTSSELEVRGRDASAGASAPVGGFAARLRPRRRREAARRPVEHARLERREPRRAGARGLRVASPGRRPRGGFPAGAAGRERLLRRGAADEMSAGAPGRRRSARRTVSRHPTVSDASEPRAIATSPVSNRVVSTSPASPPHAASPATRGESGGSVGATSVSGAEGSKMVLPSSKTYASVTLAAAAAAFASASSRRLARARSASARAERLQRHARVQRVRPRRRGQRIVRARGSRTVIARGVHAQVHVPHARRREVEPQVVQAGHREPHRVRASDSRATPHALPGADLAGRTNRYERAGVDTTRKKKLIMDSRFVDRRDLRSFCSLRSRALLPLPRSGHGRDRVELFFRQTHRAPLLRAPLIQVRLQRRDAARLQPT